MDIREILKIQSMGDFKLKLNISREIKYNELSWD